MGYNVCFVEVPPGTGGEALFPPPSLPASLLYLTVEPALGLFLRRELSQVLQMVRAVEETEVIMLTTVVFCCYCRGRREGG